ncbi:hypothetical protein [Crocosphaera chwakensis]|uniref:DUF5678 domain-containing protein n=1 Tax=Crocosphaera chwakensis CCY0110 TaxID=391612 RepID=A3IYP3_9CHRO|nr:hypothetical protein [Crocosphaera chwakensis]EAZ88396.1 hypothetical protein CY0110_04992 [Crocosphaera chwakensis CCY0110]
MSKIITFEEMQRSYDGEWLLIAPKEVDEDLQVIKGEVLAHSPIQEDIYQALESVGEQPLAIEYVGKVPEDLAFIL